MRGLRPFCVDLAHSFEWLSSKYLAAIGLVVSAVICVIDLLTINSYYVFVIFFVIFVACALYSGLRGNIARAAAVTFARLEPQVESRAHKIVNIAFVCLLSAAILVLSEAVYSRPVLFLILTCVLAGLVAVEIAVTSDARHVPSSLLKIIILGIVIRASAYFEFPSAIAVDPYYHVGFIQFVLDYGHVPATVAPYANLEYTNMPMFHLLVAALSLSSGISVHNSYFFVGIIECVSVAFVFLIGRAVLNVKSGLFAALLLVLASQFLMWGIHITPLTLGVVTTLVLLVVVFLVPRRDMGSFTALFLVLLASALLTHEGTAAYTALVLVVVVASFALVSKAFAGGTVRDDTQDVRALSLHLRFLALLVTLFVGSLIVYWGFIGGSALSRALAIVRGGVTPTSALQGAQAAGGTVLLPSSLPLWSDLPVLILILLATFGFLYLLSREKKRALSFSWLVASALILAITAAIYFLGGTTAQPERWIVYLQVFMVIPAAAAILTLGSLPKTRTGLVLVFSAVLFLSLAGITHPNAKVVSELPWDQRPRIALLESETAAASTIAKETNGGPIATDLAYAPIFKYQHNVSNVTVFQSLSKANGTSDKNGSLLLRVELANNVYIASSGVSAGLGADRYQSFEAAQNVVYDSGNVQVVTAR
jgi:hypothetical protein